MMSNKNAMYVIGFCLGVWVFPGAQAVAENCVFKADKSSLQIQWTAYKTTAKAPVKGWFKEYAVKGNTEASSLEKLLQGMTVTPKVASLDTKDPGRNMTLLEHFFKVLLAKSDLLSGMSGRVSAVTKDKLTLNLSVDGNKSAVPMTYTYKNGAFAAEGNFAITAIGGNKALESISKACKALHTGPDGKSKTWDEVKLNLTGKVTKSCKS